MGFPRQECWRGLPCPPPGDLPNPGTETASPVLQAGFLRLSSQGSPHTRLLVAAAAAAASLQSCPTLFDPINGSPPGSAVAGILQARTLEWVAISLSNAWKWSCSVVPNSVTPWTVAYQAPPSMGFPRQEYWSGLPLPSFNISYLNLKRSTMM